MSLRIRTEERLLNQPERYGDYHVFGEIKYFYRGSYIKKSCLSQVVNSHLRIGSYDLRDGYFVEEVIEPRDMRDRGMIFN